MENEENKGALNPSQDDKNKGNEKDYKALYEAEVAKNAQMSKENANQKNRIDELCSENKKYKDENYARLSQEEKDKLARQQEQERIKAMENELAMFKRKNSYVSAGYSNEEIKLLEEKGENASTFAEIMANRQKAYEEQLKLQGLTRTPTPHGTSTDNQYDVTKMTGADWNKLKEENPDLYNKKLSEL
jgi:hypothetical protein